MLLKVPFSKEKQKYLSQTAAELEKPKVAGQSKDMPFPPSYYILKPDMMDKLGYPLPEKKNGTIQLPEGFVSTIKRNPEGNLADLSASKMVHAKRFKFSHLLGVCFFPRLCYALCGRSSEETDLDNQLSGPQP